MKMSEKEETNNAKVKVLVVILFTIITITVLHILINESISQEKVIASIDSKNISMQMSEVITLQHTDVLTGIENKNN